MDEQFKDLSAYLDGELSERDRHKVEEAIAQSEEWADEYGRYTTLRSAVRDSLPEAQLSARVLPRVEAERRDAERRRSFFRFAAVAAAILVIGAVYFVVQPRVSAPANDSRGPIQTARAPEPADTEPELPTESTIEESQPAAPAVTESPAQVGVEIEAVIPDTDLPIRLTALIEDPIGHLAYIEYVEDDRTAAFRPGREILPDVTFTDSRDGAILLQHGDKEEFLKLDSPKDPLDSPAWQVWAFELSLQENPSDPASREYAQGHAMAVLEKDAFHLILPGIEANLIARVQGRNVTSMRFNADELVPFKLSGSFDASYGSLRCEGGVESENGPDVIRLEANKLPEWESEEVLKSLRGQMKYLKRLGEAQKVQSDLTKYCRENEGRYPQSMSWWTDYYKLKFPAGAVSVAGGGQGGLAPDAWFGPYSGGWTGARAEPDASAFYPGRRVPERPETIPWLTWYPEYSTADRYLLWEQEMVSLREQHAQERVVELQYENPDMTFWIDAWGELRAESIPEEVLPDSPQLRASCQNNLKQLGLVIKMFENEARDELSPPGWETTQPEYLVDRRVLTCPTDPPGTISYEMLFPAANLSEVAKYYAVSLGHMTEEEYDSNPAQRARAMAELPIVTELTPHHANAEGYNVLFADGHVTYYKTAAWQNVIAPYVDLR